MPGQTVRQAHQVRTSTPLSVPALEKASAARVVLSRLLDVAAVCLLVATVVSVAAIMGTSLPVGILVALVTAGLSTLIVILLHARYGAGLGGGAMQVRIIDSATGLPRALPGAGALAVDISRGAHPMILSERPSDLPASLGDLGADVPAYLTIEMDDGRRISIRGTAVLGRTPGLYPRREDVTDIVLTDFSRTVDRVHATVALSAQGIHIQSLTDRASTWVEQDGQRHAVAPGSSREIIGTADLHLGERRMRISRREATAGAW